MANELLEREEDVRAWMQDLAAIPLDASPSPDARQLWWKAELLKRWDAQRRVVAPIERAEPVHISISMAGAVALLAWLWRSVSTPNTALLFATVLSLTLLIAVAALALQAPVWKRLSRLRSWARSAGMIVSLVGLLAFCATSSVAAQQVAPRSSQAHPL